MSKSILQVALIGNPNAGKSSLFNELTGLHQKIGNFPGVTVEKKTGLCKLDTTTNAEIIDLPGTYSLYPRSLDERIVFDLLTNLYEKKFPDVAIVVIDASNLKRSLFLFSQLRDLGIPVIIALNMLDVAFQKGIQIDIPLLKKELSTEIIPINARKGKGIDSLKKALIHPLKKQDVIPSPYYTRYQPLIKEIKEKFSLSTDYLAFLYALQTNYIKNLSITDKIQIEQINQKHQFTCKIIQAEETIHRYEQIEWIIKKTTKKIRNKPANEVTHYIDKIVTHAIGGYVIFFSILFLVFQAIFSWASIPMNFIDQGITELTKWVQHHLPPGPFTDLLTEGVLSGLGGILMFIPQIIILFTFISILEETGYMARVVFLMDKIMRKVGLSGKSVVPLISGVACAIPAIMTTRNIQNQKERLITIFVTPLMSCSARIPVYTILIALVIPNKQLLNGLINLQGIALMSLYLLGFIMAILSALLLKYIIRSREKTYFMMEFPTYKMPRWKHVGLFIWDRAKSFTWGAGKIIMAISIILWILASYGPKHTMEKAQKDIEQKYATHAISKEIIDSKIQAEKLEHSFAGHIGKAIEPAIKPLGFDWKIGIALITSFAAREVFVGTMSTIYSIGKDNENQETIKEKMKAEVHADTGAPVYTTALAFSLLIFYVFAMQCMSTLAVTYRETNGWKWPLLQLIYMTGLAYAGSFITYQILS